MKTNVKLKDWSRRDLLGYIKELTEQRRATLEEAKQAKESHESYTTQLRSSIQHLTTEVLDRDSQITRARNESEKAHAQIQLLKHAVREISQATSATIEAFRKLV